MNPKLLVIAVCVAVVGISGCTLQADQSSPGAADLAAPRAPAVTAGASAPALVGPSAAEPETRSPAGEIAAAPLGSPVSIQAAAPAADAVAEPATTVGQIAADAKAAAGDKAAPTASEEKPDKRSGKPENVTFDDLNTEMPADAKWDAKYLTDRIKELDGKTVRIAGVMLPDVRTKGITEFVMLKNSECLFGPGGPAHHVIMVHLGPGESTRFTTRALNIEGVLRVKPWEGPDGNTWALYDMRDGVVK